ncbi:MAG: Holliday junction resolvase RuvX [Candidatus Niyogibacteria bacterium CG10_big_fil_rev_8_21_14_0_10_46_36]|uniref:Putative pre-16S rRNA nuclease n=1 Tax=Candidatus Niyogibacteria bacterium CG10_big_fil_rev_8_21_14_0_10_46_36 TaxID=1974726 RepID=A0A2H0TCC9_9BACT|nr:MAG: Holliday junction resolvase RuvX [Candidatus Niyogibacteria bacterium CG10_big_fil_rev_8_21_14_0_10_46_36]
MSRILGIDYGLRKAGLALSDEGHKVAFPKGVYPSAWPGIKDVIADILAKETIAEIVIGLPLTLEGDESDMSRHVREFVLHLKEFFNLPIHFENESFTSRAVQSSGAAPPHKTDASAAALILQSFLDRRNQKTGKDIKDIPEV